MSKGIDAADLRRIINETIAVLREQVPHPERPLAEMKPIEAYVMGQATGLRRALRMVEAAENLAKEGE